jgi:hypothetical protein
MKDFRARLNGQKSEINPEAWKQMSEMLDHLQPKRKRRWWFFIFFFVFIGTIFGLFIKEDWNFISNESISLNNKSPQDEVIDKVDSINQIDDIKSKESNQFSPINQGEATATNQKTNVTEMEVAENHPSNATEKSPFRIKGKSKKREIKTSETSDIQDFNAGNIKKKSSPIVKVNNVLDSSSKEINTEGNSAAKTNETYNENSEITFGSSIKPNRLISNELNRNSLTGSESKDIQSSKRDLINLNDSEKNVDSSAISRDIYMPLLGLTSLATSLNSNKKGDLFKLPLPTKVVRPETKLYYAIRAGYIFFNENPGYQVGLGIFRDQNNVIGFESEIVYSYGSMQGIEKGKPFTYERQMDFNLLVHLNLVRTKRHKISIELGSGWTFYNGVRVNQFFPDSPDVRKSNYNNYNGGLSYSYFMNSKNFLGIRFGFISYDDAVMGLTLRYGRKF